MHKFQKNIALKKCFKIGTARLKKNIRISEAFQLAVMFISRYFLDTECGT